VADSAASVEAALEAVVLEEAGKVLLSKN
jgi:hypothetical protein